jgi:SP family facilitated glucose transporter-like MFS transporter 8
MIGVCLMTFQQTCGAIVVVMNCAEIFASAGFKDSKMVSISVAVTQFLANIVACGIMDRIGRRILLLSMALVMCFCHIGLGTFFQISTNVLVSTNYTAHHTGISHSVPAHEISWLAITCLLLFYITFSLSWCPIPWIVMSEIFPLRARGIAGSIATVSAFGCAFLLTWLFVHMQNAFTVAGVYWFYAACCFLSFIFVLIFLPETKGQSLETIETFFESRKTTCDEIE